MNTLDKCRNCGGERGLHHYSTDQCPVGGREAPVSKKQEWKMTTFEIDDSDDKATIATLTQALEEIANGPFGKSAAVKRIARAALAQVGVK